MSEARKAFESHVNQYDTFGDEWQDKGVDEHFIAGYEAGKAARAGQESEPFAFCFTDVNGKPSEFCDHPKHAAEGDTRIRTPLYTHPASADVPDGWTFTRESDGRIVINADGLGFYVARLEADRIAEILLYALANDLLNDGTSKADEVSDFNAEIRTVRDICDEYQNYLVFVSRGKSEPYLHVPDDVNEDVLAEAIKRLNATPTKAKSVAEDSDYIDALQGTFDIIQADANTERNYEALCRVGATLKELKAKQEQDK